MTNFYNIYDKLSQLNENVLFEAGPASSKFTLGRIYGIDVTDQGNSFREQPLHDEKPLSDFLNVEETILKNSLTDPVYNTDPKAWPLVNKLSYFLKNKCKQCSKELVLNGQAINDAKNRAKGSYDIERLCTLCSKCRNKLSTKSDEKPQILTYSLGQVSQEATNVGQFKVQGFQKAEDSSKSLWAALLPLDKQPQETRDRYKATTDEDMKSWQAFCTNTSSPSLYRYAFKCPSCKQQFIMSNHQLYQRANGQGNTEIPANLVWCSACMTTEAHMHSNRQTSFMTTKYATWLDPQLFDGGVLTDEACKLILEKNSDNDKASKELSRLRLLSDSERAVKDNNKLKAAVLKHLPKTSETQLRFICANEDCQQWCADNGKENIYWAKLVSVSENVFHGCPNCLHRNNTGSSESERRLCTAVEYIFKVKHKEDQTNIKIKPFNDIDILFEYNSKLIGIEYDGRYYHKDPMTIETDEKKVKTYTDVKFLRVREKGCATFNTGLADCIEIPKPITDLTAEELIKCLVEIGHVLIGNDFSLTAEQERFLKQLNN